MGDSEVCGQLVDFCNADLSSSANCLSGDGGALGVSNMGSSVSY